MTDDGNSEREPLDIGRRFATALDHEDYPAASALLHSECVYTCRGETHRGPEAIVASYRDVGDAAHDEFESIAYESSVTLGEDGRVVVRFVDRVTRGGETFTFECEQWLTVDGGQIVAIGHVDLPGQREALLAFRERTAPGAG